MSTTILSDYAKMQTDDLIDAIHDTVCSMENPVPRDDYDLLFNLVDELRRRSQAGATGTRGLDSRGTTYN